jgi:anti-sigma B factor antagonist
METQQSFRTKSIGGLPVVRTPDYIDISNADQLSNALLDATEGATDVVVDMTITTFCGCSGLNVLVKFNNRLQADGGELRLVCDQEHVLRPMATIGLDRFFRIFADLPEALARRSRHSKPRGMAEAA